MALIRMRTYSFRGFIYSFYQDENGVRHEIMETRNPQALRRLHLKNKTPLDECQWRAQVNQMLGADHP